MLRFFRKLRKDENGATAIEYGLIAGLISVVIITAVTLVGSKLEAVFNLHRLDPGHRALRHDVFRLVSWIRTTRTAGWGFLARRSYFRGPTGATSRS